MNLDNLKNDIEELDNTPGVTDKHYQGLFSTLSKVPLGKGQTWKSRALWMLKTGQAVGGPWGK